MYLTGSCWHTVLRDFLAYPIFTLTLFYTQPQHTTPDIFVWLLSNQKRIAYARVQARDILYSSNQEARGIHCGKIISLFLKVKYPDFLPAFTS